MRSERKTVGLESAFIWVSLAALAAVVLANVVRVAISPGAALLLRASLFALAWTAGVAWALAARQRAVLSWLAVLLCCAALVAVCEHFSGGISAESLVQIFGAGGAGVGVALGIRRCLDGDRAAWLAAGAALFGCVAAIWLALEPGYELWKLLPNNWEVSKNLDYRWGIRMGQERARFLFDTPMEAGVVQWFLGVLCLTAAMKRTTGKSVRLPLAGAALLLFGSVALTYSRAGLVLGALSIGIAVLMSIRNRKATVAVCVGLGTILAISAVAANRAIKDENPAVKNVASIFDPAEEANQIRLTQFMKTGQALAETPWHGKGARSFVTFQEAPRMPEHESLPVGLIVSFGIGGCALVLAMAWQVVRRSQMLFDTIRTRGFGHKSTLARLVVFTVPPFAVYTLVAPILSGLIFGMICFTIIGLLSVCEAAPIAKSGKL